MKKLKISRQFIEDWLEKNTKYKKLNLSLIKEARVSDWYDGPLEFEITFINSEETKFFSVNIEKLKNDYRARNLSKIEKEYYFLIGCSRYEDHPGFDCDGDFFFCEKDNLYFVNEDLPKGIINYKDHLGY